MTPTRLAGVVTGYATESPAWSSRDVAWVIAESERRGEAMSSRLKDLKALLKESSTAKTSEYKSHLAAKARAEAKKVRAWYEANPIAAGAAGKQPKGKKKDPLGSLFGPGRKKDAFGF